MTPVEWFLTSSIADRLVALLLVGGFSVVMFLCFRSLTGSATLGWYRGVHTMPAFQLLMWIGAVPLLIPALFLYERKRRTLRTAPLVGNIRSRIVHHQGCEYAIKIGSFFSRYPLFTVEEAIGKNFRPCRVCDPSVRRSSGYG
jgi:hypothetical protein